MSSTSEELRNRGVRRPSARADIHADAPDRTPCQVAYDALVLDARLRQSLVTVRSLGSRGLKVAAMGTSPALPTFSSRWCQHAYVCPAAEGDEAYVDHLEHLLMSAGAHVLIASSDATLALIRRHRKRLELHTRIALASEPALGLAVRKERTLEIAEQLGLGVPRSVMVKGTHDVRAALGEIGLPAVVKPVQSWAWDPSRDTRGTSLASRLATTGDEARQAIEELQCFGMPLLFQQFLPGRREAMMFLYARGAMYARFAQWAKRTIPPLGGVSVLRQSIAIPEDIGPQAERLIREVDLEGYCEVEFRRDSSGKPYLMEINPRLSASVEVAVRAGIDFPYLLCQWARGDRIDTVSSYRVGQWMRYLNGDLMTTWAAVRHERGRPGVASPLHAILSFCLAFFTPTGYDYLNWRDLLPAWMATIGFLHQLVAQHRRQASGKPSKGCVDNSDFQDAEAAKE